jgi:peptide deformylase
MQHEIDHLDGLVYLDRLDAAARKTAMAALRETSWFIKN